MSIQKFGLSAESLQKNNIENLEKNSTNQTNQQKCQESQ